MPAKVRRSRPPLPRFAVAWFPGFDGIERVEAFRREHDPMARLVPAHLTLVFPFPTALTRLQVETHVRRVVSRWPPIAVSFRGVRLQANEFLFLLGARGAASVTALHDKLYTRSLRAHLRRDLAYEPHITIARDPDLAVLEAARDEAERVFTGEFPDVIRALTLLSVRRDGRIERLDEFALYSA